MRKDRSKTDGMTWGKREGDGITSQLREGNGGKGGKVVYPYVELYSAAYCLLIDCLLTISK